MLGNNIRELRKQNHMTQLQLAEKLNVTRQAISKWESGYTEPDTETLKRLSSIFNITIDELINGIDDKSKDKNENKKWGNLSKITFIFISFLIVYFFIVPIMNHVNTFLKSADYFLMENQNGSVVIDKNYQGDSQIIHILKDTDIIYSVDFDINIIDYKEQRMVFKGELGTITHYTLGRMIIEFEDGTNEILKLNCSKYSQKFEKEMDAKNIKEIKVILANSIDNQEIILNKFLFDIEEYMYGYHFYPTVRKNENKMIIDMNKTYNQKYNIDLKNYFDSCFYITNNNTLSNALFIGPIYIGVYKDNVALKEFIVANLNELDSIVIDEEYRWESQYELSVRYNTPKGLSFDYRNLILIEE